MVKIQKLQRVYSEMSPFHSIPHLDPLLEETNVTGFSISFQGYICVCIVLVFILKIIALYTHCSTHFFTHYLSFIFSFYKLFILLNMNSIPLFECIIIYLTSDLLNII